MAKNLTDYKGGKKGYVISYKGFQYVGDQKAECWFFWDRKDLKWTDEITLDTLFSSAFEAEEVRDTLSIEDKKGNKVDVYSVNLFIESAA